LDERIFCGTRFASRCENRTVMPSSFLLWERRIIFMPKNKENTKFAGIFTKKYWQEATLQFKDVKILTIAALIVALRIAVKFAKIRLAPGLNMSLDGYVNSLGSVIYGPVVGLAVGLISDTLGVIVTGEMGEYFPPFALVEMSSSFLFGLFFWRRKINFTRALTAKFSINFISNIVLTSIFMKWMYYIYYGIEKAQTYNLINGVRIAKNLIMFPLEATLIVLVLSMALPILAKLKLVDKNYSTIDKPSNKALILQLVFFTLLSVGLVLLYVFVLKDAVSAWNIKIW
jgi:ECF transporter S component (folate family)